MEIKLPFIISLQILKLPFIGLDKTCDRGQDPFDPRAQIRSGYVGDYSKCQLFSVDVTVRFERSELV